MRTAGEEDAVLFAVTTSGMPVAVALVSIVTAFPEPVDCVAAIRLVEPVPANVWVCEKLFAAVVKAAFDSPRFDLAAALSADFSSVSMSVETV
jgi:hypothetical protein